MVHGALHPLQGFIADHRAGELLAGALGLSHQHGKPPGVGDVQFLRLQQQRGERRVINDVQHAFTLREQPQIHRRRAVMGIHPHRGGVDDDLGIGVAVQMVVIVRTAAGNDGNVSAQLLQRGLHRDGGPAAAQHQRLFPGGVDAAAADHIKKAEQVRVVAVQRAVRTVDEGVDALQSFRRLGQLPAAGHHRLLVGNRDVQAVPAVGAQKGVQVLLGDLKETVVILP